MLHDPALVLHQKPRIPLPWGVPFTVGCLIDPIVFLLAPLRHFHAVDAP